MGTRAHFIYPKDLVSSLGSVPNKMYPPDMCLCMYVDEGIRVHDVSEEPLGAVLVRMFSGMAQKYLGLKRALCCQLWRYMGYFF